MKTRGAVELGDIVEVGPTKGMRSAAEGTVVRVTRFGWCAGVNTITVYVPGYGLVGCDIIGGSWKMVSRAKDEVEVKSRLAFARETEIAALSKYPIWAERFAAGHGLSW